MIVLRISTVLVIISCFILFGCTQKQTLQGVLSSSATNGSSSSGTPVGPTPNPTSTPNPAPTATPTVSPSPSSTPVLTSVTVSPSNTSVSTSGTQQFTAVAKDQNGNAIISQPSFTWSVTGGGSISASGLFTASGTTGGPFTVTAQVASSAIKGSATVTVSQPVAGCSSSAGVNTWQNLSLTAPLKGIDTFAFALDTNHPGTIYLGSYSAGIFKSTDCGGTWIGPINTGKGNPNNPGVPTDGSHFNSSGSMIWAMTIDPTDSVNTTLYSTIGYGDNFTHGVQKSTDGGTNWNQLLPTNILSATSNGFVNHISMDPTNHLHLVADFHVDQCTGLAPPGAPIVQNNNFQNPTILSYTQSTLTGGSSGNTGWACLAESTNGGVDWTTTAAPAPWGGADGPGITVIDDKTWFFGQQSGKLWRTTTGGVAVNNQPAWTQVNLCTASGCTTPMNGSTGFVYIARDGSFYSGGNLGVVHSTDGVNWTQISGQFAPSVYDYNGLSSMVDTGTTLYAPNNATTEIFSASISAIQNYTSKAPTALMTKMTNLPSVSGGNAKQMGYDPVNHYVYLSDGSGGFWRLNSQ